MDILRLLRDTKIKLSPRHFWHRLMIETSAGECAKIRSSAMRELEKNGYYPSVGGAIKYIKDWRRGVLKEAEKPKMQHHKDHTEFGPNGEKVLTTETSRFSTVDDMIAYHEIDLSKYEVEPIEATFWEMGSKMPDGRIITTPLHRLKIRIRPIKKESEIVLEIEKWLETQPKAKRMPAPRNATKEGVLNIADLHFGAAVKAFLLTKDFNENVVFECLEKIAEKTNERGYKKLTVSLLGDLIESWTGLNHMNTWQELDSYGVSAVRGVYRILFHFLSKLKGEIRVKVVSGNHDRVSQGREMDMKGGAAELVAFMLEEKGFQVEWSPLLISEEIDGMHYIFTHGDYSISKREPMEMIYKHGNPKLFNLLISAHQHNSKKSGRVKTFRDKIEDVEFTSMENYNFLKLVIRPIFSGNFYSQSLGFNSASGFTIIENGGQGLPNVFDYCI